MLSGGVGCFLSCVDNVLWRRCRPQVSVAFNGSFGSRAGPIRGSPWRVAVEECLDPACVAFGAVARIVQSGCGRSANRFDGPLIAENVKRNIQALQTFCTSTLLGLTRPVQVSRMSLSCGADESQADSPKVLDQLLDVRGHLANMVSRTDEVALSIDLARSAVAAMVAAAGKKVRDFGVVVL